MPVPSQPLPFPWPPGSATGVGSLPGVDPDEATRIVVGELAAFPHLVELPAAGVGADMVGRGAAHLVGLHVDVQPSGWRFAAHEGADERRARAMLARDLDVLEEHTQGYAGPLKIQVAGPWTLVSSLELHYGDKALADPGAVRDITAALAEGIGQVARDVARRVPGATVVVQFDEPLLPAALVGRVPTASGFGTLRIVESSRARDHLRTVVDAVVAAGAVPIAHCCASSPPIGLFAEAGMRAVSVDATLLTERDDDAIGEAVEAGVGLFLGLIPSLDADPLPRAVELASPARRLWSRLGFAPEHLARDAVVTPTCGLAGASPSWPKMAYHASIEVARVLLEAPEET
ncbi:MAG TPA: methionine synthase [Acidothermaceae bacterium]|nr:methionine synthase [Acidothermaceae bacterium]